MHNVDFGNYTVSELKSYIREMTVRVTKNIHSKELGESANELIREFGTYRRKGVTYVKLGFSGARKSDLLTRASQLRVFAGQYESVRLDRQIKSMRRKMAEKYGDDWEDEYTYREYNKYDYEMELNPRAEKAYQTFIKRDDMPYMTRREWNDLMEFMGDFQASAFAEFGSTLINDYNIHRYGGANPENLAELVYRVTFQVAKEKNLKGETMTREDVMDAIRKELDNFY